MVGPSSLDRTQRVKLQPLRRAQRLRFQRVPLTIIH
jgi:hypothetical protein